MPKDAVDRTTKSRRQRHRGMAAALTALVVATTAGTWAGQSRPYDTQQFPRDVSFGATVLATDGAAVVEDGMPLFSKQSPPILRPDYTGSVQVEIVYAGSFSHLRIFQRRNNGTSHVYDEYPLVDTRTLEGRTVSVFRPSWTMGEFVRNFGLVIDFDSGIGATLLIAPSTVPLGPNGAPTIGDNVFIRSMSTTVGNVPVVQIDATVQYSSHVVNLVAPGMAGKLGVTDSFDSAAAFKLFYSHFGDDYEQVAFVFREEPFSRILSGGKHGIVRNRISGIGLRLEDGGGPGRLEGVSTYLHTLNNGIANHELGHQWGSFFYWPGIAGIDPRLGVTHDPLWTHRESILAAFLAPNRRLRPLGGVDWETEPAPEPTQIHPHLLYAMGRLAAGAVPPVDIFEDQNRVWTTGTGVRMSGTTRRVTIDEIVAYHGPRVGAMVTSVRQATILVSRDGLATPEEMAYWTLQAQRLEDPHQTGMVAENGIGSFHAISGVPLTTRVIPPAGGPTLAGHTMLEPDVLDPCDMAGVVLDAAPRFDVPSNGIFRLQGRIVDPVLAGATRIGMQIGGGNILTSNVAPDGSFSIKGSPDHGLGRFAQRLFVTLDGLDRNIAGMRNVRVFGGTRIPPPPVALSATASGSNVTIQWSPDTGSAPTSYIVDVGSSSGAANIGSFPMTATTLSASGVPNGRYYLRVRAVNAAGVSAPSAETVLTVGCAPPQPPTTLTGTVNGATLTLAWQPSPTSGVSYTVIAGSTSGASNIAQAPVGTATTLTAPVPPGHYFIRVRAVTPCGGTDSNEVELIVGSTQLPGAPANLTHQVTGGTVSFSWLAAAGAVDGYVLEAGSQPALSNLAVVPVGNVLSFSAAGVPPGTYYVRVRAFNAAGQGPPSNETAVLVP